MTEQNKRPSIEWTISCKEVTIVSIGDDRGDERIHIEAYDQGAIELLPAEARELLLGALLHLGTGKSGDDDHTTSYALELCHIHMMARDKMQKEMQKEMGDLHLQIATLSFELGEARGALKKHE